LPATLLLAPVASADPEASRLRVHRDRGELRTRRRGVAGVWAWRARPTTRSPGLTCA